MEARIVLLGAGEELEETATPTRKFSLREITTGLPDDSRDEDEREAELRIRDLRGRAKRARAEVANTSGLAEILANDWRKAAAFHARFGVTEEMFRRGVRADPGPVLQHGEKRAQDVSRTSPLPDRERRWRFATVSSHSRLR